MTEETEFVHIYQARSDATNLAHGIEFQVEDRMRDFEGRDSIVVSFADGEKCTLNFVERLNQPQGYVVGTKRPWADAENVHIRIVEIGSRKFRVDLPDHLKSTWHLP